MLDCRVNKLFLQQDAAKRDLRTGVIRTRSDGLLQRLLCFSELRLAGTCAVTDQGVPEETEQLIIRKSFKNSSTRNFRCLRKVAEHEAFLSGREIADDGMWCKRGGALKFRFGHPRFLELPKPVGEVVVKSCRVGKIAKPCL